MWVGGGKLAPKRLTARSWQGSKRPMNRMPSIRLYTDQRLAAGASLMLDGPAAHYLLHVMRRKAGDQVLLFNEQDGEWRARIRDAGRKSLTLLLETQSRPPAIEPDLWLLFAPVKRQETALIIEKATELGVSRLMPVLTRHSQSERVRIERWRSIAREAAEQCERLSVPGIEEPRPLDAALRDWPEGRLLYFCDERGDAPGLLAAAQSAPSSPAALLVGPEGGFAEDEAAHLRARGFVRPVSLGPRILRAETAAIAGLTILRAVEEQRPQRLQ